MAHFALTKDQLVSVLSRHKKQIEKRYSPEVLAKYRKKAYSHARSHGDFQNADDFGSFVLIELLRGRVRLGKRPNMEYLYLDWKRDEFGCARSKDGIAKLTATVVSDIENIEILAPVDTENEWDELCNQHGLSGEERVIFLLQTKWQLTDKEIGELYGLSSGRISQKSIALKEIIIRKMFDDKT